MGGMDGFWMVTCLPFDAIVPGEPLHYVVQARRMKLNRSVGKSSVGAGTNPEWPGQTL